MATVITIEGSIGAGKSSLLLQLKDFQCFPEPIKEWSLLQNFYDDMYTYAMPFQLQVLLSYHKMHLSFKNINDKVILERCPWSVKNIFTNMLVDNGYIKDYEYNLYCDIYNKVAFKADIYIYLKVDADVAYRRILNRNRMSERSLQLSYLETLTDTYDKAIQTLDNVYIVDANQSLSKVKYDVLDIIENL
jgi:deoxyadenosine/deoxycytidine kinase